MDSNSSKDITNKAKTPKVFISYSWTSQLHQDRIRHYAERLVSSGFKVVMDIWDLKPGQDKYAFMERMVNDPSITHVLAFLDKQYTEKANARQGGVGTESQILSQELYSKITQTRILPIFCEKGEDGDVIAPTFFKSKIGFDFSTPASENESWVQLLRTLIGKSRYVRPALGPMPSFLLDDFAPPSLPTNFAFDKMKPFYEKMQSAEDIARQDYENAAFGFLDTYRVHVAPSETELVTWDETVQNKLNELLAFRNQFIEWIFLDIQSTQDDAKLTDRLKALITRMISFKGPPEDLSSWHPHLGEFDVVETFLYEITLYLLAMLVRFKRDAILRELLMSRYYARNAYNSHKYELCGLDKLYCPGVSFHRRKDRLQIKRIDLLADWVKEHAMTRFATFTQLSDADGILCLGGLGLCRSMDFWYPRTYIFRSWGYNGDSIFTAARYKEFALRISNIFGGKPVNELKRQIQEALKREDVHLNRFDLHFGESIDISNWGTEE